MVFCFLADWSFWYCNGTLQSSHRTAHREHPLIHILITILNSVIFSSALKFSSIDSDQIRTQVMKTFYSVKEYRNWSTRLIVVDVETLTNTFFYCYLFLMKRWMLLIIENYLGYTLECQNLKISRFGLSKKHRAYAQNVEIIRNALNHKVFWCCWSKSNDKNTCSISLPHTFLLVFVCSHLYFPYNLIHQVFWCCLF